MEVLNAVAEPGVDSLSADALRSQGRAYDSFVVRTWTDAETRRLLAAEVEHVQTGALSRGTRVSIGWIAEQIRDWAGR